MSTRRDFGTLRKLPSGNWQASYIGSDGQRHNAPGTFFTKTNANAWLRGQQADIARDTWYKPVPQARRASVPTFADCAARMIAQRAANGLSPNTARRYRGLLNGHLLPTFGATPVDQITVAMVNDWHASYLRRTRPRGPGRTGC